jgi:hypothetical protein
MGFLPFSLDLLGCVWAKEIFWFGVVYHLTQQVTKPSQAIFYERNLFTLVELASEYVNSYLLM